MSRIAIIVGHPDTDAFSSSVAKWYEESAENSGHQIELIHLAKLSFDPILHKGYSKEQKLEKDLERAQSTIQWAEHLVIIYPNWWGSMPALLKGFFDRVMLPGFAFKFDEKKKRSVGLLKGKTARIILLMRQKPAEYREKYPYAGETVKHSILEFCGIKPVTMTEIGPAERLDEAYRKKWEKIIRKLAVVAK